MKPKNNAVLRRESFGCKVKTDGMNTEEVLQSNRGNGEMCGWYGIFRQADETEIVFCILFIKYLGYCHADPILMQVRRV